MCHRAEGKPGEVIWCSAMDSVSRLPCVLYRDGPGCPVGITLHPGVCVIDPEETINLRKEKQSAGIVGSRQSMRSPQSLPDVHVIGRSITGAAGLEDSPGQSLGLLQASGSAQTGSSAKRMLSQ